MYSNIPNKLDYDRFIINNRPSKTRANPRNIKKDRYLVSIVIETIKKLILKISNKRLSKSRH